MLSERTAMVISVSNRAAAGVYADTTGPRVVDALRDLGFRPSRPGWCPTASRYGAHCWQPYTTRSTWS